jgi:hypothetical protein
MKEIEKDTKKVGRHCMLMHWKNQYFLKCPYNLKQFTDSGQSLSKDQ